MTVIYDSEQLIRILADAAEAGAYGSGEVSVCPKGGGDFLKLYKGGIARTKAVISASGFGGRKKLLELTDSAAKKLSDFSGEGIIRICSPFPAVIARAEENGFIRIERDIEIIFRGVG
ncbi:MAG: hypothetical protein MSJ26_10600 [Oscillospiraceae bacterium]|nr:hypothetical protein [Oscillospiraceae bacterium]